MSEQDPVTRWIPILTALSALRGGQAESQVNTSEGVTIRTRFTLPLLNALGIAASFCGAFAGLALLTWGVSWLLGLEWDLRGYVLAWVLMLLLGGAAARGLSLLMEGQGTAVRSLAATGAFLVFGVMLGSLLFTTRTRLGWQALALVVGAGLSLASIALFYNQAMEVTAGYWRRSPFEQAVMKDILPALSEFMHTDQGAQAGEVRVEDPRWTMRRRRDGHGVPVPFDIPLEDHEEPEEFEYVTIDPEAGNLIWFVRYAARIPSLTIRDLEMHPAPLLPFKEDGAALRLRKRMIRKLLARGSTENEVVVDGKRELGLGPGGFWALRGQGATAEWVMEQDEAMRRAGQMWRNVMGDVPVPDYWRNVEARRAA